MSTSTPTTIANPQTKSTKRKLYEALSSLDEAMKPTEAVQPPTKRPRFPGSLYSTLAKYGINTTKDPQLRTTSNYDDVVREKAPLLSAIVQRAASKARKTIPFKQSISISTLSISQASFASGLEYRPSSTSSFLSRLSTYKLSTYSNKPPAVDAVAAAKCGWVNDGKDRLVCGICKSSWILASRDGMTREAAHALLEKQRSGLVDNHKDGCPWKIQQCDSEIYCIQLKAPTSMAKDVTNRALAFEKAVFDVEIRHPLSSSQVLSVLATIAAVRQAPALGADEGSSPSGAESSEMVAESQHEPSEVAVLVAMFGWSLAPAAQSSLLTLSRERTNSSISRAGSPSRASSLASSMPRMARVSSLASVSPSRDGTPGPSITRAGTSISAAPQQQKGQQKGKERDIDVLYCESCQRRVGLWTFKEKENAATSSAGTAGRTVSKRQFDLLKEHRSYCPYVMRSTCVPTLPSPMRGTNTIGTSPESSRSNSDDLMEGWKAVLTVVLRSGLGRRQRQRIPSPTNTRVANDLDMSAQGQAINAAPDAQSGDALTVDEGIHAMVEGVKSHGGRDLLRYVRGLFE